MGLLYRVPTVITIIFKEPFILYFEDKFESHDIGSANTVLPRLNGNAYKGDPHIPNSMVPNFFRLFQ